MVKNILGLFDGHSGGQIALNESNIKYENYYASEIDKYAMQVTQSLYPNTIQLGDVSKINVKKLPKIDLLIGGSPCNDLSFSGRRKGLSTIDNIQITTLEQYLDLKNNEFEFFGQSYLFWEYVRILKELKPTYFFLENVQMIPEIKEVFSKALGFYPIKINSSKLSAQNRIRNYWTNIPNIEQPEDLGIVLKDIIEDDAICDMVENQGKKLLVSDIQKSHCLLGRDYKGWGNQGMTGIRCGAFRGRNPDNPTARITGQPHKQMLEIREDEKTNCLTTVGKDNVVVYNRCVQVGEADINGNDIIKRVYSPNGKSPCLNANQGGNQEPKISTNDITWRKLTPKECGRLQTIPEPILNKILNCGVSKSQLLKMFGNGWTIKVIQHFFKELESLPTPLKSTYDYQLEENLW